jgi:hypothetical protein
MNPMLEPSRDFVRVARNALSAMLGNLFSEAYQSIEQLSQAI